MSCANAAPWWERSWRALVEHVDRVLLAALGILVIVARAFVPAVAAVDTPALLIGGGVLVFGVVLPSVAEAELGVHAFKYKRMVRDRDAQLAFAFPDRQVAALRRFALRLVGDEGRANELVDDALARTYADWHLIGQEERRFHVLCTLVQLVLGAGTLGLLEGSTASPSSGQGAALAALEVRARAMLLLRHYADLPEEQIATIMNEPPDTVRAGIARAEEAVQVLLSGPTVEPS